MKNTFDKIYDKYHQDIYRFVFYMVKDKQLCDDLVQDIYIRVLQSLSTFRGESSKKTWLLSIARHVVIDYFRSQKRKRNFILDFFNWHEKGELIQDHLRSEEHTSELQSRFDLVCRLLLEKKKKTD